MHRIKYTKLTGEQIGGMLAQVKGPESATALCGALVGKKLRIVTDNGPVLKYEFFSKTELALSENGGAAVRCGYGAKTLKHTTLFTHMIPGDVRGYAVVLDWTNRLVTVFDIFFAGNLEPREVQREIYYGYVDDGSPVPEKRHTLTNRFEGKCLYWKNDRGEETLEFYPSVMYSSFVELGTKYGGTTYCAPTDYIKLSEHMYIYSRVEAEFSGKMTFQVVDLFKVQQIGFHLGIDEKDVLHYDLFAGEGKITGQLTSFEPFTDTGETLAMPALSAAVKNKYKGFRPVYRPRNVYPSMTAEEVRKVTLEATESFGTGAVSVMSGSDKTGSRKMEPSDRMAGKTVRVRYDDGRCWEYSFEDDKWLNFRAEGETEWHRERYEAFEPAEDMFVFSHLFTYLETSACNTVVLDLPNSLSTCLHATMGNEYHPNEINEEMIFGVMEGEGYDAPKYLRHHATDELVGKSFAWNYSDAMSSIHVYSTPHSYSWTIFLPNYSGGMMWSSPCLYGKLRDDTYMFSWVEEECNGSLGVLVFNTRTMHDCGYFYGVSPKGLTLHSMGAYARSCGSLDIKGYFDAKVR